MDGGGGREGGGWRRKKGVKLMALPLVLLAWVSVALAFNLEPRAATIYDYPGRSSPEREAYFGYAVALQYSATDNASWVVMGAPRANSTNPAHSNIVEPGAVFKCPFPASESTFCQELDPLGIATQERGNPDYKVEHKDFGWLGGSLDSQPNYSNDRQATCVCSPLWKAQYEIKEFKNSSLANGACYWTPQSLFHDAPFNKDVPLSKRTQQIREEEYIRAYGQFGFSVHFPADSTKIMMGAPGMFMWTGSVYFYTDFEATGGGKSRRRREADQKFFDDDEVYLKRDTFDMETDSLLGYALASGMFQEVDKELYVAGAPRHESGKVLLFEFRDTSYKQKWPQTWPRELKGEQLGEYFGAALTAGDLNGDGLTDLVVGAPMYWRPSRPDVGRIHVYTSREGQGLRDGPQHIYGRGVSGARFGLTLAAADLNRDKYQDVMVGAPWEDGGRGAVYIFLGSEEGLRSSWAQHLTPQHFAPGLRGFGMALSRGIDIDQNGYPDLAVGSVLSDKVVLVRTRPIAVLKGSVVVSPRTVPFDEEAEITVTTCVWCEGHRIPADIPIQASFSLDHSKTKKPVPLAVLAGTNTSYHSYTEVVQPDQKKCQNHKVTIKSKKQDPDDGIVMRLEYVLLNSSSLELIKQPIAAPDAPNSTETVVGIAKGCAEEVCKVDMRAEVAFPDGNNSSIIIGKINRLDVTVSNEGEHAYLPSLVVTLQPPLVVSHSPHQCNFHASELVCNMTNPLKSSGEPEQVEIGLLVDPRQMTDSLSHTRLEVRVEAVGDEQNSGDNDVSMELQLAMQAEMKLHGLSMEEQVAYNHKEEDLIVANNNLKFNHTYVLIKNGSANLEAIDLVLDVPISFSDGQKFVTAELKEMKFFSTFNCSWRDNAVSVGTESGVQVTTNSPGTGDDDGGGGDGGGDLSTQELVVKALSGAAVGTQFFNCSSDAIVCAQLSCHLEKWMEYTESARVTVELEVDLAVLAAHISVQGGAVLSSSGTATIRGLRPHLAFIGNREVMASAVTLIQPESLASRGVPWWVILLAVLAGLLLLTLLAYALYKKGFFKREKQQEMKAHRARLQSAPTAVSNPAATGD